MSRTDHSLRSAAWYLFARMFHLDNRESRRRGREKREKDRLRVDAREDQRLPRGEDNR